MIAMVENIFGLTCTLVMVMCFWIRHFTILIKQATNSSDKIDKNSMQSIGLQEILNPSDADFYIVNPKATCHIIRQASINARASVRYPIW